MPLAACLVVGAATAVAWPVTLWLAVGAWLVTLSRRRTGGADRAAVKNHIKEAEALAAQAEAEDMPASAEYWRAEAARLRTLQSSPEQMRPPGLRMIVLGCAVASAVTVGALMFAYTQTDVSLTSIFTTAERDPQPSPHESTEPESETAGTEPSQTAAPEPSEAGTDSSESLFRDQRNSSTSLTEDVELTGLGNIAKEFSEIGKILNSQGEAVLEFIVNKPSPAPCVRGAARPANGQFLAIPVIVETFDDPIGIMRQVDFNNWGFVYDNGFYVKVSSFAVSSCRSSVPFVFESNRHYEFEVVVDVPPARGSLVLQGATGSRGWEWRLDDWREEEWAG